MCEQVNKKINSENVTQLGQRHVYVNQNVITRKAFLRLRHKRFVFAKLQVHKDECISTI